MTLRNLEFNSRAILLLSLNHEVYVNVEKIQIIFVHFESRVVIEIIKVKF